MPPKDYSAEVTRIMDEAGLDSATFLNGKKSMVRIVIEVRTKIFSRFMDCIKQLLAYIKQLEEELKQTKEELKRLEEENGESK